MPPPPPYLPCQMLGSRVARPSGGPGSPAPTADAAPRSQRSPTHPAHPAPPASPGTAPAAAPGSKGGSGAVAARVSARGHPGKPHVAASGGEDAAGGRDAAPPRGARRGGPGGGEGEDGGAGGGGQRGGVEEAEQQPQQQLVGFANDGQYLLVNQARCGARAGAASPPPPAATCGLPGWPRLQTRGRQRRRCCPCCRERQPGRCGRGGVPAGQPGQVRGEGGCLVAPWRRATGPTHPLLIHRPRLE